MAVYVVKDSRLNNSTAGKQYPDRAGCVDVSYGRCHFGHSTRCSGRSNCKLWIPDDSQLDHVLIISGFRRAAACGQRDNEFDRRYWSTPSVLASEATTDKAQLIAFLTGYITQNITYTLWTGVAGTLLAFVAIVPPWPFFNKNTPKWLPAKHGLGGISVQVDGRKGQ